MNKRGTLVVISGPSGGGKGTVVKRVREMMPELGFSVSATTRAPRPGEEDGREYFFVTRDDFEEMIAGGEILEYTHYCGNYYGTPREEAARVTGEGRDLILEIEVEGAAQIKRLMPEALTIMLIPPTITELEARLRSRGTETEDVIAARVERAREEIKLAPDYDYIVINENEKIEECAEQICNIIRVDRQKSARMKNEIDNFLN